MALQSFMTPCSCTIIWPHPISAGLPRNGAVLGDAVERHGRAKDLLVGFYREGDQCRGVHGRARREADREIDHAVDVTRRRRGGRRHPPDPGEALVHDELDIRRARRRGQLSRHRGIKAGFGRIWARLRPRSSLPRSGT